MQFLFGFLSIAFFIGSLIGYLIFLQKTHFKNILTYISFLLFLFGFMYGIVVGDFFGFGDEKNSLNFNNLTLIEEKFWINFIALIIRSFLHGIVFSPYTLYCTMRYLFLFLTILLAKNKLEKNIT